MPCLRAVVFKQGVPKRFFRGWDLTFLQHSWLRALKKQKASPRVPCKEKGIHETGCRCHPWRQCFCCQHMDDSIMETFGKLKWKRKLQNIQMRLTTIWGAQMSECLIRVSHTSTPLNISMWVSHMSVSQEHPHVTVPHECPVWVSHTTVFPVSVPYKQSSIKVGDGQSIFGRNQKSSNTKDVIRMLITSSKINLGKDFIPVVWKASSTMPSSRSEAAEWKTENTFFHPDLIFLACELTICATQRTTISRIVEELWLTWFNENEYNCMIMMMKMTVWWWCLMMVFDDGVWWWCLMMVFDDAYDDSDWR